MPSPYKEIPITFEKGLVTEIEESLLDIGQAASLENWEPLPNGALRARNRYSSITTTGLTAPFNVRGFGAIATGTAVAGAVSGPQVVQSSVWPNGDADPVATKTITLTGVNIGNVLIAVVNVDSLNAPSVSGGWTERAVGSAEAQYVRIYTKTAVSSTEAFTYTISVSKIRAVTVMEVKYLQSADPGSNWAAADKFGAAGSDSLTVTNSDTDGFFALTAYTYDGGTPDTGDSGTSGWTTPTQRNANTRTGVSFQDLDQLDGSNDNGGATGNSVSYTSPSWTPPATGVVIMLIAIPLTSSGGWPMATCSVSGNGLTWHTFLDGGELGSFSPGYCSYGYAWADCSTVVGTTGAISVTVTTAAGGILCGIACSFVLGIGADTTDPFVQSATSSSTADGTFGPILSTALLSGSGLLGFGAVTTNTPGSPNVSPTIGAGNWEGTLDAFEVDMDPQVGASYVSYIKSAYSTPNNTPDTSATMTYDGNGVVNAMSAIMWEIKGSGNAAKVYTGTKAAIGTVIENYSYVLNKQMSAKMVVWGYTPPSIQPDVVDFYIAMAVATDATTYKVYRIPRDEITSGTWELMDTVTDATSSEAFVSFAQGAGYLVWTASTMGFPRSIELATLSAANITDMLGLAGRTAAYHKDRMFIAGSAQNPSRMYFSDIGDPLNYTTAIDFLDIGGDDGEAIQDLSSVEGLLLVPKTNRAYLVSGSGIESFFVNELAGGTAATGRSAIRTPYGTLLAGEDDIWVVQGGGVDPMSRPLGSGYVIAGSTSSAYAQDSVLICDSATEQVWRVNLVTGAWSIETVTGDDAGVYIVFSLNGRIYYGVNGSYATVGGTRKLLDARTYDANTGGTNFLGSTGRVALLGPSVKYTPMWLFLQTRSHDTAHPNDLHVTIETDRGSFERTVTVRETTQRDRLDIGVHKGAEWIKLYFAADSSAEAGAIDVERIVLGVDVEAPR